MESNRRLHRLERLYGSSVVKHGLAFLRSVDLDYKIDEGLEERSGDILKTLQRLAVSSVGREAGLRAFEQSRSVAEIERLESIEDFFAVWSALLRSIRMLAGNTGLVVLSNSVQKGIVSSPVVPSILRCAAHCIPEMRRDVEISTLEWEPCTFSLTERDIRFLTEAGANAIQLDRVYEVDRGISFLPEHPGRVLPIDFFGEAGQALVSAVAGPEQTMELARENIVVLANIELSVIHGRDDERLLLALYSGVRDLDVLSFILDIPTRELRHALERLLQTSLLDEQMNVTLKGAQLAVRIGKL